MLDKGAMLSIADSSLSTTMHNLHSMCGTGVSHTNCLSTEYSHKSECKAIQGLAHQITLSMQGALEVWMLASDRHKCSHIYYSFTKGFLKTKWKPGSSRFYFKMCLVLLCVSLTGGTFERETQQGGHTTSELHFRIILWPGDLTSPSSALFLAPVAVWGGWYWGKKGN